MSIWLLAFSLSHLLQVSQAYQSPSSPPYAARPLPFHPPIPDFAEKLGCTIRPRNGNTSRALQPGCVVCTLQFVSGIQITFSRFASEWPSHWPGHTYKIYAYPQPCNLQAFQVSVSLPLYPSGPFVGGPFRIRKHVSR